MALGYQKLIEKLSLASSNACTLLESTPARAWVFPSANESSNAMAVRFGRSPTCLRVLPSASAYRYKLHRPLRGVPASQILLPGGSTKKKMDLPVVTLPLSQRRRAP